MTTRADERLSLDKLLEASRNVALARREIERLREVQDWALASLHLSDGDEAVLAEPVSHGGGWAAYREVLVVGRTGKVSNLYLRDGEWSAYFTPDDCWSISEYREVTRYDKPGTCFMIRLSKLRRRTPNDVPLPVPGGLVRRHG